MGMLSGLRCDKRRHCTIYWLCDFHVCAGPDMLILKHEFSAGAVKSLVTILCLALLWDEFRSFWENALPLYDRIDMLAGFKQDYTHQVGCLLHHLLFRSFCFYFYLFMFFLSFFLIWCKERLKNGWFLVLADLNLLLEQLRISLLLCSMDNLLLL